MNAQFGIVNESYLTVADVAERLKVNEETECTRLFQSELGVLVICFPRRGRRVYGTFQIPKQCSEECSRD